MFTKQHSQTSCRKSFELFGDEWHLQIINNIRSGAVRFSDIQRATGINSATLVCRLKRLEELGLLDRAEQTCDKQSVAYSLTATGQQVVPIIDQMLAFSQKAL